MNIIDVRGSSGKFLLPSNSLTQYLKDIRKYPQLDEAKECQLIDDYKSTGNIESLNQVILSNQKFIFAVAKRIAPQNYVLDVINEGNIGMIEAAKKFDATKGFKFISFAVWYIRLYMNNFVVNNSIVRKPCNNRNSSKANKIKNRYYLEHGRQASEEEIIELFQKEFGIKVLDKSYIQDIESVSIDSSFDTGKSSVVFEESPEFTKATCSKNEYEQTIEDDYKKTTIRMSLRCLPEREREIITYLFGLDTGEEKTMEEASQVFGLTKERIRQIKLHAMKKLKKIVKSVNNSQAI